MKPFLRTCAAASVAMLALGACKSWQPHASLTPATPLNGDARVTRTDHSVIVLRTPSIVGDSVAGNVGIAERVAIPLSDVRTVKTRRTDASLTFLALGAAALAAAAIRSATTSRVVY
ncbi:MAG TPA: hypothetical protein VGB15_09985 [Longimicrobium sp.]|jgi:uncharacterized lipoprotein YbaY